MWDEARKYFAASPGSKSHTDVSVVAKDLALADVSMWEFLTTKYCLWLDLRTTDDDRLYGNDHLSEEMTIQIQEEDEAAGYLNVHIYIVIDAELVFQEGLFVQAAY